MRRGTAASLWRLKLGSINLTQFIREPFTGQARLDLEAVGEIARVAVRLLDNVIDVSLFPLPSQATQANVSRRIGLGFTGLADALLMLNSRYGSDASLQIAQTVMQTISHSTTVLRLRSPGRKGHFLVRQGDISRR